MTTTTAPRHRSTRRALPDLCPWCPGPVPTTHRITGTTAGTASHVEESACLAHAVTYLLDGERIVPVGVHRATSRLSTRSASPVR